MNFVIYTKKNCPFCEKAKALLDSKGFSYLEKGVKNKSDTPRPEFGTVPQILLGDIFIGGYTELVAYFKLNKKKTVFNAENTGHITGEYPLFLGEDLGFADSINQPYPILEKLFDDQMGQVWNHTEVDLTQDRQDMLSVPRPTVDLMVYTLLWQTLADSAAERVVPILNSFVSNSALQDWYNVVALFESIHAKTYLHIIRQTFTDPNEALKMGYESTQVLTRSSILVQTFDRLINDKSSLASSQEDKVLLAVVVLYLLEAINFMASFAITFGIAETGVYQGIASDVKLIARDELLHAKGGSVILGILKTQWPEAWARNKSAIDSLLHAVHSDEHKWTDYLFSEGRQCVGINAKLIKEYVSYMTTIAAEVLEVDFKHKVDKNPLPYMDSYIDSSKIQVAAQELQLTNYLVGAVKSSTPAEIADLLKTLREDY